MTANLKVSGVWKALSSINLRVGGVWKGVTGYIKVGGVWKQFTSGGGGGAGPCTITGSLSASGSTLTVTSAVCDLTVALGNTGRIQIRNLVEGSGATAIKNGAGTFSTVTNNDILTWLTSDIIQARGAGMTASTTITFDIYDVDNNTLIQAVVINRT